MTAFYQYKNNIDTNHCLIDGHATSPWTYIIVDRKTKSRTCIHHPLSHPLSLSELNFETIFFTPFSLSPSFSKITLKDWDGVYLDGRWNQFSLSMIQFITSRTRIKKKESPRFFLPHERPFFLIDCEKVRDEIHQLLPHVDFISCNSSFPILYSQTHHPVTKSEESYDTIESLSQILRDFPSLPFIVCTLGDRGSILSFSLSSLSLQCSTCSFTPESNSSIKNHLLCLPKEDDLFKSFPRCKSLKEILDGMNYVVRSKDILSLKVNKWIYESRDGQISCVIHCPPLLIDDSECVDSTGCGDAFVSGFMYFLLLWKRSEQNLFSKPQDSLFVNNTSKLFREERLLLFSTFCASQNLRGFGNSSLVSIRELPENVLTLLD